MYVMLMYFVLQHLVIKKELNKRQKFCEMIRLIGFTWLRFRNLIKVRYPLPLLLVSILNWEQIWPSNIPLPYFFPSHFQEYIFAYNWSKILQMSHSAEKRKVLRDKAIAVAGRVSVVSDGELKKVSCPVCLDVLSASPDSNMRMVLAVHLSLWHPDDVNLQWDIMHNKTESNLHVPSFVLGVGIATGFGALLAFLSKNQSRTSVAKRER